MADTDHDSTAKFCPLCQKDNSCLNLVERNPKESCWCQDPAIKFSEELLSAVPEKSRGKACICQSCALQYQSGLKIYEP